MLGYTAWVLAHALDNRRSHARSAMTCHPGAEGDRVQLSLLIALNRFHVEVLDEVVVLSDFSFSKVQVHLHAIAEEFRSLRSVAEQQLAHDAVCGEFVQVTAAKVSEFAVVDRLHVV